MQKDIKRTNNKLGGKCFKHVNAVGAILNPETKMYSSMVSFCDEYDVYTTTDDYMLRAKK